MTTSMLHFKYFGRALAAGALAGVAILAACNQDSLLVAPTPDVVRPSDISGPAALPAAYAAAIGDFQIGYAGGYGTGLDNNEGLAQMTGLLADELVDAETFNTRIEVDRRATKSINGTTLQTFQDIQRARATADLVASRFRQFDPTNPQGAEVQALAAFTYVLIAESYCNGVPTSKVNDDGTFSYGAPQTGRQLLTAAVAKFDSAITVGDGQRRLDGAQPGPHRQGTRAARPEPGGAGRDRGRRGAVDLQLQHPARREHRAAEQRALRLQLPRRPVRRRRPGGHERPRLRVARRSARPDHRRRSGLRR